MTDIKIVPEEIIQNKIMLIRDKKVLLDKDLAVLYEVTTKQLNQAVRRNIKRFPQDFMFQLTKEEVPRSQSVILKRSNRSQSVTGSEKHRNIKYQPYAFTELGVAMLSSVLNSERAVQMNIQIMRTFTKLREIVATHSELRDKIEKMEMQYDKNFRVVFDAIRQLISEPEKPRKKIGFQVK
jgi:hypothetical protein